MQSTQCEEDSLRREGPPGRRAEAEFRPHRPQRMPHPQGCKGQCLSVMPTRSVGTVQHEPLEAGKIWGPFVTQQRLTDTRDVGLGWVSFLYYSVDKKTLQTICKIQVLTINEPWIIYHPG